MFHSDFLCKRKISNDINVIQNRCAVCFELSYTGKLASFLMGVHSGSVILSNPDPPSHLTYNFIFGILHEYRSHHGLLDKD